MIGHCDDISERATVHIIENGKNTFLIEEDVLTLEYLLALERRKDSKLVHESLLIFSALWLHQFEREKVII